MINVTCAIIVNKGKILATQRSHSMHLAGHWEFPGGKIEPGETAEACIVREIREELNISVRIVGRQPAVEHQYPDKSIRLIPFLCQISSGEIELREHAALRWLDKTELPQVAWAEADRKVVTNLQDVEFLSGF